MKYYLSFILFVFIAFSVFSQNKLFSTSVTPTFIYYQGDLSRSTLPNIKTSHFGLGIEIGFRLNEVFKFDIGYLRGKISGADSLVSELEVRNLHFVSSISDIRILSYVDLYGLFQKIWRPKLITHGEYGRRFIGPNVILGVGYVKHNPKGNKDGDWYELQEFGTEGQYIQGGDYPEPYKLWTFNVKYGLGIGYKLTPQIHLELEFIKHIVFTDYLDDVSTNYPDYNQLLATHNGELASHFSYGGKDQSEIDTGDPRGNPGANDGFTTFGLKITYVINRNQMQKFRNL